MIAHGVSLRLRENGVRLALGATQADVLRIVMFQASGVAIAGLALGVAGSLQLSRALDSQLHGVTPNDPLAYGVALGVLAAAIPFASWLPARRAAGLSPSDILRGGQ